MKKVLFSLLAVLFLFSSCGSGGAVKFNDTIIEHCADVTIVQDEFDTKVQEALETKSFESIKAEMDLAVAKIDASLEAAKAISAPSGGEDFQAAAIKMIKTAKMSVEAAKKLSELQNSASGMDVTKLKITYDRNKNTLVKSVRELESAQNKFAKANNMRLE